MSLREEELLEESGLPDNTFPKIYHLRKSREFRRVFQHGKKVVTPSLVFHVLKQGEGVPRLGLAVSKKVGNAVVRNRVKRRIREVFRTTRTFFFHPYDIVVYPRKGILERNFEDYRKSFTLLLARMAGKQKVRTTH